MTPPTIAAMLAAWSASSHGETCTTSPKTTTPSTMPAAGSAAVTAGSEACSGAALKAFCISQSPTRLVATVA